MKIYIYATGLFSDGSPHLTSRIEGDPFVPEEWQLIHTQEIHFNISKEEVLKHCEVAKKLGENYE